MCFGDHSYMTFIFLNLFYLQLKIILLRYKISNPIDGSTLQYLCSYTNILYKITRLYDLATYHYFNVYQ